MYIYFCKKYYNIIIMSSVSAYIYYIINTDPNIRAYQFDVAVRRSREKCNGARARKVGNINYNT